MRAIRLVLAGTAAALAVTLGSYGATAQQNPEPMIFFVAKGEANATAAVLRGAVIIDGDMELLVQLQKLFPGPPAKRGRGASGRRRT